MWEAEGSLYADKLKKLAFWPTAELQEAITLQLIIIWTVRNQLHSPNTHFQQLFRVSFLNMVLGVLTARKTCFFLPRSATREWHNNLPYDV